MRGRGVVVALAVAAVAGCGGSEAEPRSGADACVKSWNVDAGAMLVGTHAYDDHGITRAIAERIEAPEADNIRAEATCVVVFAVEEGDAEFGQLGLVVTRYGWSQLFELGVSDAALDELQRSASEGANASLLPDGKLALD